MPTRRLFLKRAAALGAGLLLGAAPRPVLAASLLRGATHITPAYRQVLLGMRGFVDALQRETQPETRVELFDSASLLRADELLSGLQDGRIDFMFHATTYLSQDLPVLGLLGLPVVCEALCDNPDRLTMDSALLELINTRLAEHNLVMLVSGGSLEPEYLWSSAPVASMDDLAGLRCRVMGCEATRTIEALGMEPLSLPSSQLQLAVRRRAVDAVLANVSTIMARNIQELFKHCFRLPLSGFAMAVFLRKDTYDALPQATRSALAVAGRWYDANQGPVINRVIYPDTFWPRLEQAGVQIRTPQARDMEALAVKASSVWNWWRAMVGDEFGARALALAMGEEGQ
jgi:TRAP-type C4-dicarboxylate transport system substrate-binding protein